MVSAFPFDDVRSRPCLVGVAEVWEVVGGGDDPEDEDELEEGDEDRGEACLLSGIREEGMRIDAPFANFIQPNLWRSCNLTCSSRCVRASRPRQRHIYPCTDCVV